MKILSIAIPCYNSESYMRNCVDSLLPGGEDVEILIVNDGSSDHTREIAEEYQSKYPAIVKAIHQENGGHGAAVNTGLANATGRFFKVVDSDDWVDGPSYEKILKFLKQVIENEQPLDMLLSNYVYEKVGAKHKKVMKPSGFPESIFFTWNEVGHLRKYHYILMHSIIYRTELLRRCHLELPRHTFYVDNIYAFQPLPYVKTMYYLDVDFYRYFIGREDQSVNEKIMVKRIDQQIKVNRLMVDYFCSDSQGQRKCFIYMRNYLEIITVVSFVLTLLEGTKEGKKKKKALWKYIHDSDIGLYHYLRKSKAISYVNLPGPIGRKVSILGYRAAQRFIGFN